ncbi:proto-oncogene DBL-like isoform X4 [Aethina tumida]|uniref:proto-oncogene DBL-like isoform X4 n=1 Tax=Aethina tumida TaxID=116153 RepID=UPI0021485942|nr:proto-oncogene DBL-like isoform X4 [Aethina tumida]
MSGIEENHNKIGKKTQVDHIVEEILNTEQNYLDILNVINFGYKKRSIDITVNYLLPPDFEGKFKVIFSNTNQLEKMHSEFFEDLVKSAHSIDLLAECFIKRENLFLDLYTDFCMNHYNCIEAVNSNDLQPFFKNCQQSLEHDLYITDCLDMSLQRISKYKLLLKQLLKETESQHLTRAFNSVNNILDKINKSVSYSLQGLPEDLMNKGKVILQGEFQIVEANAERKLSPWMRKHVFLFERLIILSTPIVNNKQTILQYDRHLNVTEIGMTKSQLENPKQFLITVKRKGEEYIFKAHTELDSQIWQDEIRDILFSQLKEIKSSRVIKKRQETSDFQFVKANARTIDSIVETEEAYVANLQDFFKEYELLKPLPSEHQSELEAIIGNLEEISKFHSDVVLKEMRKRKNVESMLQCFDYLKRKFQLHYKFYFQNAPRSLHYRGVMGEKLKNSKVHPSINQSIQNLIDSGALLEPMKRIAVYKRLLESIKLYRDDLRASKQHILDYLRHIMNSMNESVSTIEQIEGFPFHLHQGGLVLESEMFVSTPGKQPDTKHVFFFDNLILFTIPTGANGTKKYQTKDYLTTDKLKIKHNVNDRKLELSSDVSKLLYTCLTNNLEVKRKLVKHYAAITTEKDPELKDFS